MPEELQLTYNAIVQRPLQILEIFNEFFGEDKVDMQGLPTWEQIPSGFKSTSRDITAYLRSKQPFILVHFPRVKVTNEYDKYVYINHLYAKVDITMEGKLVTKFTLNRAEYSVLHFVNNYMHSHVCDIPVHDFAEFQTPCTGSGPINNTICSLIHDFDADLWRLFCLELDKFVQVESIAGTPYHRLESLTDRRERMYEYNTSISYQSNLTPYDLGDRSHPLITRTQLAEFTKYVIDNNILKFNFVGGQYRLAMDSIECLVAVSNLFIKWYNREFNAGRANATFTGLLDRRLLLKCKMINGKFFIGEEGRRGSLDYTRYTGAVMCFFKGNPVTISFTDIPTEAEEENYLVILNNKLVSYIVTKILNVLNFRYGNNVKDPNEQGVIFL